jgi:ATP-dependent DNA ligase
MPDKQAPQLCSIAREPPEDDERVSEIKFDGYRRSRQPEASGSGSTYRTQNAVHINRATSPFTDLQLEGLLTTLARTLETLGRLII